MFASEASRSTQPNKTRFLGASPGYFLKDLPPVASPLARLKRREQEGPPPPPERAAGRGGRTPSPASTAQAGKLLPLCPARPAKSFLEISVDE